MFFLTQGMFFLKLGKVQAAMQIHFTRMVYKLCWSQLLLLIPYLRRPIFHMILIDNRTQTTFEFGILSSMFLNNPHFLSSSPSRKVLEVKQFENNTTFASIHTSSYLCRCRDKRAYPLYQRMISSLKFSSTSFTTIQASLNALE